MSAQTFTDFEWLIVDDGSTDGTAALVRRWQSEASFSIRYLCQANAGKHVAFNRGVRNARGRLFLTLDSDDACAPNSLERLLYWWESIPEDERSGFSAVTTLCQDQHGRILGRKFPRSPLDSTSVELRMRYRVKGEKWGFQRTDVLRDHPFPEPEGVKFVPESTVWRAIDRRYRTRFVNEVLRTYWVPEDGRETLSTVTEATLEGHVQMHRATLNENMEWLFVNPMAFVRAAAHMSRFSLQQGMPPRSIVTLVRPPLARALVVATFPLGVALRVRDWRRNRATPA